MILGTYGSSSQRKGFSNFKRYSLSPFVGKLSTPPVQSVGQRQIGHEIRLIVPLREILLGEDKSLHWI